MDAPRIRVIDVVHGPEGEKYLYKCLAPVPFRRYRKRARYLEEAADKGLRKEVLFMDGDAVGMVEYAPAVASAYPISGHNVWVMNCIWVLRRAKGHRFGKMLIGRMIQSVGDASGIATVALDGHPSPWLKLVQMEYLGFHSVDSRRMRHKVKRSKVCFETHLMWMSLKRNANLPVMDWTVMLKGVDFCIAHPLYRAERLGLEEIFKPCGP